jgi:hypothetical protein
VCFFSFPSYGGVVFIGPWGSRFGTKWWLAGWVERPPPTFSTALAFYFLCRHVSSKP